MDIESNMYKEMINWVTGKILIERCFDGYIADQNDMLIKSEVTNLFHNPGGHKK